MIRHATPEHDCHRGCQLTNSILKNKTKTTINSRMLACQRTDHQTSIISNSRPVATSDRSQELQIPWVNKLSLAKVLWFVPHLKTERWRTSKQLHRTGEEGEYISEREEAGYILQMTCCHQQSKTSSSFEGFREELSLVVISIDRRPIASIYASEPGCTM